MNFRDILNGNYNTHKVFLGYNKNNEKAYVDLKNNPTTIITGETGSGKSTLINEILCQLIKNNTSIDMEFIFIDSVGVELQRYAETRYCKDKAIHDNTKAQQILSNVIKELDNRHEFLKKAGCTTIDEFNKNASDEEKISDLVLVIDDNGTLIIEEDVNNLLKEIISLSKGVNFYLISSFSNTNNLFFTKDDNLESFVRISFDMSDEEHAGLINIDNSNNLPLDKFTLNIGNSKKDYYKFNFDESLILETLNK